MAEIPGDIATSAAQAGYQAREVGRNRGANIAGQSNAANRVVRAVDENDTTVDTDDADAQIFADAEGAGSQGRPFEEGGPGTPEEAAPDDADGVTKGDDGQAHIDLQA